MNRNIYIWPSPSPLSSVPSSLAPHSGNLPLPCKPALCPCIYGRPHPASSTPTANSTPLPSSYTSDTPTQSLETTPNHPSRLLSSTYLIPPSSSPYASEHVLSR